MTERASSRLSADAPVLVGHTTLERAKVRERPLRIALVAPPYFEIPPPAYGGVEAVLGDLANGLADLGHQVALFGCGRPGTRAGFHPVWEQPISDQLGDPAAEYTYAAAVRRHVEWVAATEGLDVVHDHTGAGPLNAAGYAAIGLPTMATVHGPVDRQLRGYYQALGPEVGLVAISHRQRRLAPALNWVATVHNGLDPRDWPFSAHKQEYGLFLGRFHPDKGAHTALDAAHEAGVPLVLAGKCAEPAEKAYYASIVEPQLKAGDRSVGVADAVEKRNLLMNARCLVFPIQWEEPFGMVMIEAMICGTPVVALRRGAVPEVLVDGVTGFICDDPAELPDAIRRAGMLDPAACRRHVIESFSSTCMADGYASAYRKVIAKHVASRANQAGADRRRAARLLTRFEGTPAAGPGR